MEVKKEERSSNEKVLLSNISFIYQNDMLFKTIINAVSYMYSKSCSMRSLDLRNIIIDNIKRMTEEFENRVRLLEIESSKGKTLH